MDYLDLELDNMRIALEWSISNKRGDEALRLFGALGEFWLIRCHYHEGIQWFRRALELREGVAKSIQARALDCAGSLLWIHEAISASRAVLRESMDLYRELGDMKSLSDGLLALGVVEESDGNLEEARTLFEQTLNISRMVNNKPATTRALFNLANIARREGDHGSASQELEESLAICRQLDDSHLTTMVLLNIGDFAFRQQHYSKAHEYYKEALITSLKLKNKRVTMFSLLGFADILSAEAFYIQGAQLQGCAITLLERIGAKFTEMDLTNFNRTRDVLSAKLGENSYQQEFDIGRTLTLEQAVKTAFELER